MYAKAVIIYASGTTTRIEIDCENKETTCTEVIHNRHEVHDA